MKVDIQQTIKAVMLLMFSVVIIKFHVTGEIDKLINRDYEMLSLIAAGIFLFLYAVQLQRVKVKKEHDHSQHCGVECDHKHVDDQKPLWKVVSYIVLSVPILTGFIFPPKILDSSIAENKGMFSGVSKQASEEVIYYENYDVIEDVEDHYVEDVIGTEEYTTPGLKALEGKDHIVLDDTNFALFTDTIHYDPDQFVGKEVTLKGFVYKEDGFEANQLVLSRFVITHCVADASILGFFSEFEGADALEKDSWVEATGIVDVYMYQQMRLPRLTITEWEVIEEPDNPYVYP